LPPEKFRIRQRDDVLKHVFSKHDNKQIFLNDPLLFGTGFGKRKIDNKNKSKWNPEFIAWSDDTGKDRLKKTMYQNDFCHLSIQPKLLSNRKSIENRSVSVYACNFTNTDSMNQQLKEIREDTFRRFSNKNRSKSCIGERVNVASCLVWHDSIKRQDSPPQSKNFFESKSNLTISTNNNNNDTNSPSNQDNVNNNNNN
jgi:hypothetical protein